MIRPFLKSCLAAVVVASFGQTARATFVIPSTANIYGSGQDVNTSAATPHPGGSAPGGGNGGGTAAPFMAVVANSTYTFDVTGLVNYGGATNLGNHGPDGRALSTPIDFAPYNGLSGIKSGRAQMLLGVFLDDSVPSDMDVDTLPDALDYTVGMGDTFMFVSASPKLRQVFVIGDGRTGIDNPSGTLQEFIAPTGATRLFFGLADTNSQSNPSLVGWYNDNSGQFMFGPTLPTPAPAGWLALAVGLVAVAPFRRRTAA